ncbi:MAG TPA: hypothetical protein VGF94_09740 [Kofleriaceae bacterium]|jgi:hypothetical protein
MSTNVTPITDDAAAVDRDVTIRLRLTAAEAKAWRVTAEKSGLSLSAWIRMRVAGDTVVKLEAPPPPSVKPRKGR